MIAVALATVLVFLSVLHVYWAFGGLWGSSVAIPQLQGRAAFAPSGVVTFAVAMALASAALVALLAGHIVPWAQASWLPRWSALGLALLFFARSIGEFRYVGFFKRVRGTPFATWDTRLFSPLCLLLAAGFFRVATQ